MRFQWLINCCLITQTEGNGSFLFFFFAIVLGLGEERITSRHLENCSNKIFLRQKARKIKYLNILE